jgi:hypothetical protein
MTLEEIQQERLNLAAERNGNHPNDKDFKAVVADIEATLSETRLSEAMIPEVWAYDHISFSGLELDVRKPNESALIAVSMTGSPTLDSTAQMRIFTRFLRNHMSLQSFTDVVEAMTDPDSGITIQSLISEMVNLHQKPSTPAE